MGLTGIPDARNKFITGQGFGSLPQTLLTVTAGQIWRLHYAVVQLACEGTSSLAALAAFDAWIEIQGGDILVAAAEIITNASQHGDSGPVGIELGARPVAGGTIVRVVSSALPVNTVARVTAGILYSTS